MQNYNHKKIEKKWQKIWAQKKIYATKEDPKKNKFYILDMFPYPSGEGLHVGHPKGYIATDIVSRLKRMQGYSVLHPMGFDAFGLPAENYAIKTKTNPAIAVAKNVKRYKKQLEIFGFDYDWAREVNTTDPFYYKWTQWIFLKLLEKGLAYESFEPINWCPSCKTGLANEDVEEGLCERCSSVVEKKPMRQWVLRITDYAERLLADLDAKDKSGEPVLDWPNSIIDAQKNWIGKSEGSQLRFKIQDSGFKKEIGAVEVFTTRADTLFGVTYVVLAPEHEIISKWKSQNGKSQFKIENWSEIDAYIRQAKGKTEIERTTLDKTKTGVEIKGIKAVSPASGEEVPIWVADYVLVDYGTGAVMAVPAHDERDFAFAKKYNLPIREVIAPYFKTVSGPDAVRADKKTEKRKTVYVILKHWQEDKFLCLDWQKFNWHSFIIGGVEDGEDVAETAKREIHEETGFKNAEFVRRVGGEVHSHYFAGHKDVNRYALGHTLYFELQDGTQDSVDESEKAKHAPVWIERSKMSEFLNLPNNKYAWEIFDREAAFVGDGVLVNSEKFNDLDSIGAKKKITEFVDGKMITKYKLRDWVFSRQRYWGEPIPVVHCEKCGVVPVAEKDLPVKLPKVKSYEPTGTGESPLAAIAKWVNVKCPKCGGAAKRETNTMPQWAGSSWYYLAYMMHPKLFPRSKVKGQWSKVLQDYWAPVDFYVGGAEHATRHLIYARFWHKFLLDLGVVSTLEPFVKLQTVGLIMGEDGRKMSKRWGNVVNPDDIAERLGADTLRVYEMFLGPFDQQISWSTEGIAGARRFLERVWKLQNKIKNQKSKIKIPESENLLTLLNQTIKKVGEDIETMKFNTAISSLMMLLNAMEKEEAISVVDYQNLLKLLTPFAPHITEELWSILKQRRSIHLEKWPAFDPSKIQELIAKIAIQINGKTRAILEIDYKAEQIGIEQKAKALPDVRKWLNGKKLLKTVYVKGRLLNFVVSDIV